MYRAAVILPVGAQTIQYTPKDILSVEYGVTLKIPSLTKLLQLFIVTDLIFNKRKSGR